MKLIEDFDTLYIDLKSEATNIITQIETLESETEKFNKQKVKLILIFLFLF